MSSTKDYDDTDTPQKRTQAQNLQLTPEEVAVLKECGRESFWFRSLPLGGSMMAAVSLAMKQGMISPGGGLFKIFGVGLVGYVVGKASYTGKCREKIMQLENSPLADSLRKGRKPFGTEMLEMSLPQAEERAADSRLDPDAMQGQFKGLDDGARPTLDSSPTSPLQSSQEQAQKGLTYDELRQRNRNQQLPPRPSPPGNQPTPGVRPSLPRDQPSPPREQPRPSGQKKGAYGDEGFD